MPRSSFRQGDIERLMVRRTGTISPSKSCRMTARSNLTPACNLPLFSLYGEGKVRVSCDDLDFTEEPDLYYVKGEPVEVKPKHISTWKEHSDAVFKTT